MRLGAGLALLVAGVLAAVPTERQVRQASAFCRRAEDAASHGDRDRAAALFDRALAVLPSFPDAHLGTGHLAMAEGMRTLRQDGIAKVLQGVTTLGEVRSTSNQ